MFSLLQGEEKTGDGVLVPTHPCPRLQLENLLGPEDKILLHFSVLCAQGCGLRAFRNLW